MSEGFDAGAESEGGRAIEEVGEGGVEGVGGECEGEFGAFEGVRVWVVEVGDYMIIVWSCRSDVAT